MTPHPDLITRRDDFPGVTQRQHSNQALDASRRRHPTNERPSHDHHS